jgi:hypothetical protein
MKSSSIKYANVKDFEEEAKKKLSKPAFEYYTSGAEYMVTAKEASKVYD